MAQLMCVYCGRVINTHLYYTTASYKKHVKACRERTPAERASLNNALYKKEQEENAKKLRNLL